MRYLISTNHAVFSNPKRFEEFSYETTDNNLQNHKSFFLNGYLRHNEQSIGKKDFSILQNSWPLPDDYSGSFAFTLLTKNHLILANDCIGVYPLFYHFDGTDFTVCDSLSDMQKALHLEIDEVGKAERLFAPEQSEIGSRTLLKNVKRLLPGEKIAFDVKTKIIHKSYDNRLYANMHNCINTEEVHRYWQILVDEIKFIEGLNNVSTDIAISGGLDSRILIGAMTPKNDSVAYHYGKTNHYETKVAKKIAKHCSFEFKAKMDYSIQFPVKAHLEKTINEVGPPYSMNWYNIFDISKSHKTNLILGDMCEALHGRNIKAFSTRKSRINSFFKHYILDKPYKFTPTTKKVFDTWKSSKTKDFWEYIHTESLWSKTNYDLTPIKDQLNDDLEDLFKRIEAHNLPYVELYDELFKWFTHSRIPMGRQITHCNERFFAYAPSMSTGLLIATSNIHPNLRLNYRFKNKLFKQIKALKKLNTIPTNQVPFLSRRSPASIQFLVWGIRSQIDQVLINRILKQKNPDLRYRVFESLNWVEVYQSKNMVKRLESYFEHKNLNSDIIDACIELAKSRKKLDEWPLSNTDIMSICILNLEIDCLKLL
jgi:hypothetical protein